MRTNSNVRPETSVRGLANAVAILQEVATHNRMGLTLTQVSTLTGLPKPTAHRLLAALVDSRLLSVRPAGNYHLGALCATLGGAFLAGVELRDVARPELEQLAAVSGETCHLGVLDGEHVVYIDKIESANAVRMYSRVGMSAPVHCSALGKAMLANLKRKDAEAILSGPLQSKTPNTITNRNDLERDLDEIRHVGFAVDREENELGIECVGAAIRDHTGQIVGAMSVSVPKYRLGSEQTRDLGRLVREMSRRVSEKLGYRGARQSENTNSAVSLPSSAGNLVDQ